MHSLLLLDSDVHLWLLLVLSCVRKHSCREWRPGGLPRRADERKSREERERQSQTWIFVSWLVLLLLLLSFPSKLSLFLSELAFAIACIHSPLLHDQGPLQIVRSDKYLWGRREGQHDSSSGNEECLKLTIEMTIPRKVFPFDIITTRNQLRWKRKYCTIAWRRKPNLPVFIYENDPMRFR